MNDNLASLPPVPNDASIDKNNAEPPVHLSRLLSGLMVTIVAFDSCFWNVNSMGLSVAVFVVILAGVILANRQTLPGKLSVRGILILLAGGALGAAIETGITNTLVLLILIIVLAGQTYFQSVESMWGRWLSQVVALVRAPGRIFWLAGVLLEAFFSKGLGGMGSIVGGCLLAVPALILALIFGSLLATGNAVFGSWTDSFFDWFWKELALYLNFWRIILWVMVAIAALPLLRPVKVSAWWWSWIQRLPRLPEMVPTRGAVLSSGLVLVVLNLLFLVANVADAMFLWTGQKLPVGVTYSGFVHNGTNALTWTVLLSAVVLTVIFQQALQVAQRRELKALALFWIAQNLFLLASVGLRLKLYVEAYDMTVLRLSVIIFLVLVGIGYGLLTIKIVQDRSLSWLIGGCMLAVFATFYVTQFLDLAGWSANYNVACWEKDRTRSLDTSYLYSLGPDSWPALSHVHEIDRSIPILSADDERTGGLQNDANVNQSKLDRSHWREFSLRAWLNRWALEEKPNN
jgi:hypothetical protein